MRCGNDMYASGNIRKQACTHRKVEIEIDTRSPDAFSENALDFHASPGALSHARTPGRPMVNLTASELPDEATPPSRCRNWPVGITLDVATPVSRYQYSLMDTRCVRDSTHPLVHLIRRRAEKLRRSGKNVEDWICPQ